MTRQTSIEAYNTIKENGLLSLRRWQFYDVLFRFGPLTQNECARKVELVYKTKLSESGIGSRLSELRTMGVVQEVGKRRDSITGMKNILWDCTKKLPIKLEKPKRIDCPHCNGKGYLETQQTKMF